MDIASPEGLGTLWARPGWHHIPLNRIFATDTSERLRFFEAFEAARGFWKGRYRGVEIRDRQIEPVRFRYDTDVPGEDLDD